MTVGISPNPGDGFELLSGAWAEGLAGGQNANVQTVVAHAGGLQPSATQISPDSHLVYVKTVASAGDSTKLPAAKKGLIKLLVNGTATSSNVFGKNATDTINGTLGSTAYTLDAHKSALFFCPADGIWGAILTA